MFEKPSRLSKGEVDTRNPWTNIHKAFEKLIERLGFSRFHQPQPIVLQDALGDGNGFAATWGTGEINAPHPHRYTPLAGIPVRCTFLGAVISFHVE